MAKPFAWSYSALTAWESCPRQFAEVRIKKAWPDEKGEAAKWGIVVHEAFEARLKYNTPLPEWGKGYEAWCTRLQAAGPQLNIEHKAALTRDFKPTEFFARDAWVRAVADVSVFNGNIGYTLDWKAGKQKFDTDQLRLSAAINLCHRPHLEKQIIQYAWLQTNKTTSETLTRNDIVQVWRDFLPRVQRMEKGLADQDYVAKPNGLCRAYCPVLSCEHNGRRK